ncbi:hypothetical protein [Streptomyces sp. PvR006]|uniref:hypothetical protein n=1 Tax=Streptomyces sp. PvR006 TaxID=2817860 RepID=UPI001AE367FD|nr:hypothetical protein [Streptomyces sp. PvR006]
MPEHAYERLRRVAEVDAELAEVRRSVARELVRRRLGRQRPVLSHRGAASRQRGDGTDEE